MTPFLTVLLLAIGLALDATAVAAARGLACPKIRLRHALLLALFFGGFQTLMPLIGYAIGVKAGPWIERWDHWIAFALLVGLGGIMLWEARKPDKEKAPPNPDDLFRPRVLFALAIATSIDALAAGITLPMMDAPLATSLATIGITTAILSILGLYLGKKLGATLGPKLDIVGGLVLIGLGCKVLFEHLWGAG